MSGVVLVTGGTGKTGGRLIARLTETNWTARCASRSGQAPDGIEGAQFDWFEPSGHAEALAGVERVYLVAPPGAHDPVEVMEPFIEQAVAGGVRRFVLLSSSLIAEGGPAMGAVHALLRRRAREWVVLRPSWFMENFSTAPNLMTIRDDNVIHSATDGGVVPFVAVKDIAEVALHALTSDQPTNSDLLITGPVAISYSDAAAIIGAARNRPVQHIQLTGDELAARFEAAGIPRDYAAMLAGLDRAIADGAEARTTSVVADMTGSEPQSFEEFAKQNADVWRQTAGLDMRQLAGII